MAFDFSAWPTVANINTLLGLADTSVTLSGDVGDMVLASAIQEMTKRTGRQFLAGSSGEVRYYDGSGTNVQIVDDYVDITAVEVIGISGATGLILSNFWEAEREGYPKNRIYTRQGSGYQPQREFRVFPADGQNIKVTGTWGYGATIPVDVWEAVQKMAALKGLENTSIYEGGRQVSYTEADRSERFADGTLRETSGWGREIEAVIKRYRKPLRQRLTESRVEVW